MENHKRTLGIIYVVTGSLQLLGMLVLSAFISTILTFAMDKVDADEKWVVELILPFLRVIPWVIITLISLPSIIAGIGLLQNQKWALVLALVLGCLSLFSFPVGTIIGVYAIWVYAESNRLTSKPS